MMRKVPLRTINERLPDDSILVFNYLEYLGLALRAGGPQGLTAEDMKARAPLIAKVEAVPPDADHILLEEADYKVLVQAAKDFRFRMFLHAAIQWLDEVAHASTVEVEEKEAKHGTTEAD